MDNMFPEARRTLQDADPEVYKLVQEEKKRQWCARAPLGLAASTVKAHEPEHA